MINSSGRITTLAFLVASMSYAVGVGAQSEVLLEAHSASHFKYDLSSAPSSLRNEGYPFHTTYGDDHSARQEAKLPLIHKHIRIVVSNDIHGHEDESNPAGGECNSDDRRRNQCIAGAARRMHTFNLLRRGHPYTLFMDSGDVFQGPLMHSFFGGMASAHIMNIIGYTAMTLGNHEFDDGIEKLVAFIRALNFPVVCSNLDLTNTPSLDAVVLPRYIIPGYNIGLVGFTTVMTKEISLGRGVGSIGFLDPAEAVQRQIDLLYDEGATVVFALSHNGYRQDMKLVRRTRGLKLVFGGHSHTLLSSDPDDPDSRGPFPTVAYDREGKPVYIVQSKKFGEYVGYLDLTMNDDGDIEYLSGQAIHQGFDVPQEPSMYELVQSFRSMYDVLGGRIISRSLVDMDQVPCKVGECRLGNLVMEAMRALGGNTGADLVLFNSDVMRAGLRLGDITLTHVAGVFPNANQLVLAHLTGRELRQAFEGSATERHPADGHVVNAFVQAYGVRLHYNFAAKYFAKVEVGTPFGAANDSTTKWTALEDDRVYKVLTTNFIAMGGDHVLAKSVPYENIAYLSVMLALYLQNHPVVDPALYGHMVTVDPPSVI
ncbi:hypothetical protein IWQ60_011852 [Tieghemiomyces parasiticus]|uniref:5'-nucleotidase n=1 Tax=Tieghemiomyces parasiticus TaxID=78921 RepID=A0A9W8DL97_9FUNG|nr:hypothetical protein IWQ60_011852 [Tieghemiomyces parasiticus]